MADQTIISKNLNLPRITFTNKYIATGNTVIVMGRTI